MIKLDLIYYSDETLENGIIVIEDFIQNGL